MDPIPSSDLIFISIKWYNTTVNVKLSNSQLNELNSAIKNETGVVLRLSSNMVGDNETNFPQKLLLTKRQVENIRKAFASQSGGFLGDFLVHY